MKIVIITMCILLLFCMGSVFFSNYVQQGCYEMLPVIENLKEAILDENWEQAQGFKHQVTAVWENHIKVWAYLMEHQDLDRIELALEKLSLYLLVEEKHLSLGEVAELKLMVEIVGEKESFKLVKLF